MGLKLIKNNKSHWPFILYLRTHPKNLDGFVDHNPINYRNHICYMTERGDCYMICISNGIPVGYIGDTANDIRLAIHPDFQGEGIGTFMLQKYISLENRKYFAKVLELNEPSNKLFMRCGFRVRHYKNGLIYYEKDTTQPL